MKATDIYIKYTYTSMEYKNDFITMYIFLYKRYMYTSKEYKHVQYL